MLACLAQGALAGVIAGVIGQAGRIKDGSHRDAGARGGGGKDGGQAGHRAAVVVDSLDRGLRRVAGGDGGGQVYPQNVPNFSPSIIWNNWFW